MVLGAVSLGAVLYQSKVMILADLPHSLQVERLAVEVNPYHRFGLGSDLLGQVRRVQVECPLVHICKDRLKALIEDAVGRGYEGEVRGDHLIPHTLGPEL